MRMTRATSLLLCGLLVGCGAQQAGLETGAASATPTAAPPSSAAPASPTPTVTPTPAPTASPTPTPTPEPTPSPTAAAELDYTLTPVYGSTAVTSGFVPDPFSVGITGGGPVAAGYLGGGCGGHATSAPSFSVNYTSGAFSTLRFYAIASGDTTMIINTPSGSWVCVDDSFGTLNPTIDFNTPSSGRYDVWLGTYASGASIGGTLYVTENTGNHP